MNSLDNIVVTHIDEPFVVHSKKGRSLQMTDRDTFGLSFCINGQITYTMNGKSYVSNQGNAVLLPLGATYHLFGDKEGFFPVINFECDNLDCTEITVIPLKNPQMCIQRFETIKDMFLLFKNRLEILGEFYKLLAEISSANSPKQTPLETVMEYIEENISDCELSNVKLARKIGISEVYLRKLFVTHYKITPKQYILELRIRKAKQMLVDTSFSVTEIAEGCGFSSLYHFCRTFKDKTGMTPTEYAGINKIYKI